MPFESFIYGKKFLPFSITNPDVNQADALDSKSPFSFFEFLKQSTEQVSPLEYNTQYQAYLQTWYASKNDEPNVVTENVRERYVELLQDIALNYTTAEEKRFLLNIDYANELDLNIVIPFYSRKIKEICDFYRAKREQAKYSIERNKAKGNESSIAYNIVNQITNQLTIGNYTSTDLLSSFKSNVSIEFEELYDYYTNYFDIDPNSTADSYDRDSEFFTANVNDIEANLFINFNDALKAEIFNNVFLTELGRLFTINYNLDSINLDCKKGDKLYQVITDNKAQANESLNLKKKLIEKYIGTDFYYISTNSDATPVSGMLFNAVSPQSNLLNRHFPSTASVEEYTKLKTLREIGTLFTPEKTGLLHFSAPSNTYVIDESKLEANKVYVFPDPSKYGSTSGLTNTVYDTPVVFVVDNTNQVQNQSMFYAEGVPFTSPYTQNFYSYFSKNQLNGTTQDGVSSLHVDFAWLNNIGNVAQWKTDIYGNQYCLFKAGQKQTYTAPVENTSRCITIDGHVFYDNTEYYNYVYNWSAVTIDSQTNPTISYYKYTNVYATTSVVINDQISDITYNELSGTLMLVNNFPTSAYEIDVNGNLLRSIVLSGFTDVEGIAWLSGGLYAFAEENVGSLSSRIVVIDIDSAATNININAGRIFTTHISAANSGIEGLAYNSSTNTIYYATKKPYNNVWLIYTLNLTTSAQGVLCNITALSTNYGITDISSLYYNNSSGRLFVMSQEQNCVVQIDTNGNYIDIIPINGTRPEGLAFTPNLSVMYVAGEPSEYYKYIASNYTNGTVTSFTLTGSPTTLYFREFAPYETCGSTNTCVFYDCANFTFNNGSPLPQQYSADIEQWPGTSSRYYYSLLLDAGVGRFSPLSRALSGNVALSASFTTAYNTSAVAYSEVDCGYFTDTCALSNDYKYAFETSYYVSNVAENAQTTFAANTAMVLSAYDSVAFVKNAATGVISPLSSLQVIFSKYSTAVKNDIYSNTKDIAVFYDRLFLTTSNYFVIDKVKFDGVDFIKPQTANISYNINNDNYTKLVAPFFFEQKDYCLFAIISAVNTNSNYSAIYPTIYKYNYINGTSTKLYPTNVNTVSSLYVNNLSAKFVNVKTPKLCYNSSNDMFAITYITEDPNAFAYINQVKFTYKDVITIDSVAQYAPKNAIKTINLNDNNITNYSVLTSALSGSVKIYNNKFLLL